jgi:hypothetical protein
MYEETSIFLTSSFSYPPPPSLPLSSTFVLPLSPIPSYFLHKVNWCLVSTANCRSLRYLTMSLIFVVGLNGRQRYVAVTMGTTLLSSIPFDWWVTPTVAYFVHIYKALSVSQNYTEYKLFTNVKIRKVTAKIRMCFDVLEHILQPARLLT